MEVKYFSGGMFCRRLREVAEEEYEKKFGGKWYGQYDI